MSAQFKNYHFVFWLMIKVPLSPNTKNEKEMPTNEEGEKEGEKTPKPDKNQ